MCGTFLPVPSGLLIACWVLCLGCLFYFFWLFPPIVRQDDEEAFCCKNQGSCCVDSCFSFMVKKKTSVVNGINSVQRFIGLKLFVILTIMAMTSSLWFIAQSNEELHAGWKVSLIVIMVLMCN